jgi:hypothetical protein
MAKDFAAVKLAHDFGDKDHIDLEADTKGSKGIKLTHDFSQDVSLTVEERDGVKNASLNIKF